TLYDAVFARYSSPATAALGRLILPYLFPEPSAFATVEDPVSHLRASDARYCAAAPAEFLDRNQPQMFITLYFKVTRLPDSLRSVRDHFPSLNPTSLTVDLLEQHLLAAETSAVAVGAAGGTPRPPFFQGCSPSPLAPSYASVAAADVSVAEDVEAVSASAKRRSRKGKGGRGGGGGSGSGRGGSGGSGGGSSGGGGSGGTGGGSGGSGGGGGGSGGSGGSGGGGTGGGGTGARCVGSGGGKRQQQQHRGETQSPQQLREWFLQRGASRGIAAATLGASESGTLPGTAPSQALHTFTLDSGTSACFFRDHTTLTLLSAPDPIRLADPSGGPVVARTSTVLPCPAVPSGSLSVLHIPSFSTNLVSTAALQDAMVTTTTPGGQRVSICTCTQTGRHLATFTHRPGSSLYTLATEPHRDVTFDESVPFYRLFPYRSAPPPPPPLFLAPGPPPLLAHCAARGAASGGVELGVAESEGAGSGGAKPGGEEPGGVEPASVEPGGVEPGGAESEGAESGGAEPQGAALFGGPASASPSLSPQQLREWFVWRARLRSGATGAGGAGAARAGGTGVTDGAGGTGGTAIIGPRGARTRGAGGAGAGGAGGAGAGAVDPGAGGTGDTVGPRPYSVPLLQHPASPLPAPSPYTEHSGGLTERREIASCPVSPDRTARRVPRSRPPPIPGTHAMALRPSSVPLRVPLPPPPESSLPEVPDPESDRARAASPTIARLLATAVIDPSFESAAVSALSELASPPSVGGECALGTDVLEDRQEDFECLAAVVPRFPSMLLAPEGDPDAPEHPDPALLRRGDYGHRQGVDYFQTFSPTPKMTTLRVLLHVAAQRDYELHSLDFSTAFLQGSLHEEIWLRRPPGSTESFPAAPPSDESVEPSGPYPELVGCLMYLMTCTRPDLAYPLSLLARYVAPGRHQKVHWDAAKRVLRYFCSTSGMGLVLGGRGPFVLTSHADASWVDDSATQQSSLGYTFSLGSGSVSWRSTRSSTVLSSSCEAEIYAGAMAAQELRWLTYLLTDLGEQPRSPLVLYVDNKAMIALCQEHIL
ncbi:unnamed protein product, partial [Closterium sp. NIES-54]